MNLLILLVGLGVLIKSADFLVDGAISIANRMRISRLVVGLTIVSFGTSLPELLVTLVAGLNNKPDLAIANIVGSNIANVLLVLGIAAIIRPLPVKNSTVVSEIPFSLTAALLVGFLANAALFSGSADLSISRVDGAVLIFFFLLFMIYVYTVTTELDSEDEELSSLTRLRTTVYLVLGVLGLYLGGELVVRSAVDLAAQVGVDDAIVGLTIVAVGTSAPELVASGVAAYRGQTDIAVGNVVGSNIFNLLWVLGFTSMVVELPFEAVTNIDLAMVVFSSALILVSMVVSRRNAVLRWHGVTFVLLYIGYIALVIQRT